MAVADQWDMAVACQRSRDFLSYKALQHISPYPSFSTKLIGLTRPFFPHSPAFVRYALEFSTYKLHKVRYNQDDRQQGLVPDGYIQYTGRIRISHAYQRPLHKDQTLV
jgi:hypothetical protein